ncbi:hypothetical protein OMW55_07315 [Sphingomonas sp. BN140010]|uniref:Fungal lipase-like domain-containing protein n=1 Tax=Sphingomonas arvum TaxID=2992113 RepID=A0ABT3JEV8_9SPHN|nr:hypothetical protein [Sphingomonas sp. BN140010]MCW3797610.1 hypothetical protein [Sphingomonas sp. BN140010]
MQIVDYDLPGCNIRTSPDIKRRSMVVRAAARRRVRVVSITLQDQVYFGTYWQVLDGAGASLVLGGGFHVAGLERTSERDFFAGIVTRTDAAGRVTDVILAFAGAQGIDAVQGESILAGIPLDEAARATSIYDAILANPAYADARIHVMGHSLGGG